MTAEEAKIKDRILGILSSADYRGSIGASQKAIRNSLTDKLVNLYLEYTEREREKAFEAGRRYGIEETGNSPSCTFIQSRNLKQPNFKEYSQQNPLK